VVAVVVGVVAALILTAARRLALAIAARQQRVGLAASLLLGGLVIGALALGVRALGENSQDELLSGRVWLPTPARRNGGGPAGRPPRRKGDRLTRSALAAAFAAARSCRRSSWASLLS
jgi:hypothetical protein